MHVFVYCTVNLFLNTGGIKDLASLTLFVHHRLLKLLGQKLTEILSESKNHGSGNGYCANELHYQTRLGAFKRQTGQRLTVALKENRGKKSRCLLSLYSKVCCKEILFTDEKKIFCGGKFQ